MEKTFTVFCELCVLCGKSLKKVGIFRYGPYKLCH
jgi:hypothetical protein